MSFNMPPKDPDEVLDYHLEWSPRLAGDAISSSEAILESGDVTIDSESFNGTKQIVWISDGTIGTVAVITMRVVTSGGRTMDETLKVKIKAR